MKKLVAFSAPILPGKTEQWVRFTGELKGKRNKEFLESRRKQNIHERSFLQKTPHGDFVIVTLEGDDPVKAFESFANTNDEFTNWFVKEVEEIHGFNLKDIMKGPMPEKILDSLA